MPFDPTKPAQARNGRDARIYATDAGGRCPIHGAFRSSVNEDNWIATEWQADGTHVAGRHLSLVNVPIAALKAREARDG